MLTSKDNKVGLKSIMTEKLMEAIATVAWFSFLEPHFYQMDFLVLLTSCSLVTYSWVFLLLQISSWKPSKSLLHKPK